MKCMLCQSRTRIVDSRHTKLGTRRRHKCKQGHRKTTYEVSASFLFRLASDVLKEPGFFSNSEYRLENVLRKFVDRYQLKTKPESKLRLVNAG